MDYKAIEAALVLIQVRADEYVASGAGTTSERLRRTLFTSACENVGVLHLDDLLRLVRAMAWMEEQGPTVRDSRGVAAVEVYRDGCKETYFGPSVIDAIEAAMADQQTKGATDEA